MKHPNNFRMAKLLVIEFGTSVTDWLPSDIAPAPTEPIRRRLTIKHAVPEHSLCRGSRASAALFCRGVWLRFAQQNTAQERW
jgi:hypothetical protein